MLGLVHVAHRHLMAPPVALALLAVDLRRAGPALRRAEDDHRPGRPRHDPVAAGVVLDPADLRHDRVEHAGELLVDRFRLVPFDEVRLVAHALEELLQLVLRDAGEEAGVGDLVAVEVEDRQHAAVAGRVEELVAVPAGGERPRLRLAVADDAGDDQVGIVERRPVGVAQGVAELAALVDAARRLRGDVAGDAAGEAELLEQPPHPLRVLADLRIDLAVGPFEVGVGDQRRAAVPRADDVDHVQVIALDDPVEVRAEHVQARRRAPVAEQPRLDVLPPQRLPQQRVVEQVDLPDREVVGRPPVGVELAEFLRRERCLPALGIARRRGRRGGGLRRQRRVHRTAP